MLPEKSRVLDGASMNKSETHVRFQKAAVEVGKPLQNNEFQFGSFDYATMVKCGLISEPANMSLQENEVTSGKSQFQFGSLDYATMSSLSGLDSSNVSCKGKKSQTLFAASGEKDEKEKSSKNLSSPGFSGPSKANGTSKKLERGNVNVPSDPKRSTKVFPPVRDKLLNNGVLKENSIHLSPKEDGTKESMEVASADMESLTLGGHDGIFPKPNNGVLKENSIHLSRKEDGTKQNIKVPSADMESLTLGGHDGIFPIPNNGVLKENSIYLSPKEDGNEQNIKVPFADKESLTLGGRDGIFPKPNNGVLKENSIHLSPKEDGTKENIKVSSADMESLTLGGHDGIFPKPTEISFAVANKLLTNGVLEETSPVLPPKEGTKATACDDFSAKVLLPRGLINGGNLCFLNATLQALLACLPFVRLLEGLRTRCPSKADYPTLGAFVEFIANFDLPSGSSLKRHGSAALQNGTPFSPSMFDSVLRNFSPDLPTSIASMSGRPRQEDAQEFLSFVMDQMHNELLKLDGETQTASNGGLSSISSMDDDGWETVGPKNKTAITRTQSFVPSELSDIFGGQLRSLVKAKGSKASATIQPYLLLHLDIFPDFVRNIEDAFHLFSSSENLEGYRASHGKPGLVDASKSVKIQTLPKVMILHLMRFGYGANGSTKLLKPVRFPLEVTLGRELFVSHIEKRKYELVATITHHGRESSKGHYTADARHSNGQWLRYDDSSVFAISPGKVLHDQAYVLFYRQK